MLNQGIWQDAVVQIHIIRLLLHPLHPCGIFPHKTRKLPHKSEKAPSYHPWKRINSEEINNFDEVVHPKQWPKHAFLFVNNNILNLQTFHASSGDGPGFEFLDFRYPVFLVRFNAWLLSFGEKLWKNCVERRNHCPRMAAKGQTCHEGV